MHSSIAVGAVWFTMKQFKKQKKRKQSKILRFPRGDDIEMERSKKFKTLQVDMSKVHLVCNEEDWDEIFPHVSSKSNVILFCEVQQLRLCSTRLNYNEYVYFAFFVILWQIPQLIIPDIFSARVRSTTERYCFRRRLSVHTWGGGYPISIL